MAEPLNGGIIRVVRFFLLYPSHMTHLSVRSLILQQKLLCLPCLRNHNILLMNMRHFGGGKTLQAFMLDILILDVVSSLELGPGSLRSLFRNLYHQHTVAEPKLKVRPAHLSAWPLQMGVPLREIKSCLPKRISYGYRVICLFNCKLRHNLHTKRT